MRCGPLEYSGTRTRGDLMPAPAHRAFRQSQSDTARGARTGPSRQTLSISQCRHRRCSDSSLERRLTTNKADALHALATFVRHVHYIASDTGTPAGSEDGGARASSQAGAGAYRCRRMGSVYDRRSIVRRDGGCVAELMPRRCLHVCCSFKAGHNSSDRFLHLCACEQRWQSTLPTGMGPW